MSYALSHLDELTANYMSSKRLGAMYLSLLEDWSWVSRRVETVKIIDEIKIERRVSLDLKVQEIRRRAKIYGFSDNEVIPIPIAFFHKDLLLDFSMATCNNYNISLLDEKDSAILSSLAVRYSLLEYGMQDINNDDWLQFRRLWNKDSSNIQEDLFCKVLDNSVAEKWISGTWKLRLDDFSRPEDSCPDQNSYKLTAQYWNYVEKFEFTRRLAECLVIFTPASIWFDLNSKSTEHVIRYSISESWQSDVAEKKDYLSFRNVIGNYVCVDFPALYPCCNEHIIFEVPDGIFLSDFKLYLNLLDDEDEVNGKQTYFEQHLSSNRYTYRFYYDNFLSNKKIFRTISTSVLPSPDNVMWPILSWCFSIFMLLLGCFIFQIFPPHILDKVQNNQDVSSAVTILLLIPTICLAFIVRLGENSLRARLLYSTRAWSLVLLGLSLFASVSLIASYTRNISNNDQAVANSENFLIAFWLIIVIISAVICKRNFYVFMYLKREYRNATKGERKIKLPFYLVSTNKSRRKEKFFEGSEFFSLILTILLWILGAYFLAHFDLFLVDIIGGRLLGIFGLYSFFCLSLIFLVPQVFLIGIENFIARNVFNADTYQKLLFGLLDFPHIYSIFLFIFEKSSLEIEKVRNSSKKRGSS